MKKMLLVTAHPDDESFVAAGTIAKYVAAGWQVDLAVATRGESGERGVYQDTVEPLADIRVRELRKSAKLLGIHSPILLEYKDGKLDTLRPGEMESKLITLIRELQPDIVITFEPSGYTNHPDHMAISSATTYAFQIYAKERKNQNPDDDSPPKLYYACMPESVALYLLDKKVVPKESFGRPWNAVEDKMVTTVIDIKKYEKKKLKALQCHESQALDILRFYSIDTNPLARQEYFMLRMIGTLEAFFGKNDTVSNKL